MADKRLFIRHASRCYIDQIVHNPILKTEQEIEISQSRISIDEDDALAAHGKTDTDIRCRRRLANASFSGCHHIDFTHISNLPLYWLNDNLTILHIGTFRLTEVLRFIRRSRNIIRDANLRRHQMICNDKRC